MPAPRAPTVPQFARRLAIETPEHLVLELELAGVGSRIAAAACDALLLGVLYVGLGLALAVLLTRRESPDAWSTLVAVLAVLALFLLFWCYFLLFEALNHGRTPGKRLMGIRVVMDTGHPITFAAAAVRNLIRVVDALPFGLVGLAFVLFHPQNKRLGDIVAGTVVARDRPEDLQLAGVPADRARPAEPLETGPPELADEEFRLLDQYLERLEGLDGALRRRFTAELAARFAPRFPRRDPDPEAFLVGLHTAEVGERPGRLATRRTGGNNALYGRHTGHRVHVGRLLLRELPAAVVAARAYVVAALLAFAVPAMTGYLLIRERPAIAEQVLPDEMLERARAGAERRAQGIGYAQAPSMYLPFIASRIITNNVQVAFLGFAFGITAGIGTLLLLVFNGLFFGPVLGLFANYGVAGWLLTFVAGHGVLELSAIFIAGGAGLLVARALVAPGDLTRRDALVLAGRQAAHLVGAAVLLLALAGTIEGLLSASDAPAPFKLATGAATAVLLILYLASGRHYLNTQATAPSGQEGATAASGTDRR